jgi:2',3'-cyclic-nucleotide 2'-phosphodiesterase (5'-nucleotidase family)
MKKLFLPLLLTFLILFSSCAHILPQIPPSGVETNTGITVTTDPSEGGDETSPDGGIDTPTAPPVGTVPDPEPPTAPAETSEGILDPEDPELPPEEDHTDENNDGECDDCGISVVIVLDLFAINDLHGKFLDSDAQGGVDELTTYLKNAYETEDHVLLLSTGDMWQGSSESNLTKGYVITEWMNHLNFAAMTLGNHEYDWGETYIENNATLAGFPLLAINIYDRDTNERVSYCQSSVLVQRGGARIGIIGAMGDCYSSISGEMSGGIYFKTGRELTDLVKSEAQALREAGADFIVYSVHDGHGSSSSGSISDSALSAYYDPILSEGYVDIVFEGHTHQRYVLTDGDGVYHLQGGGDNKGITHAEATINFANGRSEVTTAELISSTTYAHLPDDPIVETLKEKYRDQISAGDAVLGYNDSYRSGDYLRQLVADLYAKVGEEAFSDYDVVLGGGFLSVRSPYNLVAGEVTYSQLQMIMPFDNTLVLCSVKGSDLKKRFINTSNENYFIGYTAYGRSLGGQIDNNATYYIVVDTYTSTYAPNNLTEIARYKEEVYARDLLADYIRGGGLGSKPSEITYISIPEIYRIGNALADNAQTEESYYVRGTVVSVTNTTYGNLTIDDGQGNTLYVYGVYDQTGATRYDGLSDPPRVGDTVVLCGPVKKYVAGGTVTVELMRARLMEHS